MGANQPPPQPLTKGENTYWELSGHHILMATHRDKASTKYPGYPQGHWQAKASKKVSSKKMATHRDTDKVSTNQVFSIPIGTQARLVMYMLCMYARLP